MKAGSAGSIPDDAAKPSPASQPLRNFLRVVGEAVANLNTTVVGLDAVEKGHERPAGLNISWHPSNREIAARKARRFVLEAVLVHVSEALCQYVNMVAKLSRFNSCRENWKQASVAEKLADIAEETVGADCYQVSGACLLVHWRNRVVHRKSQAKLTASQEKTLLQSQVDIEANYSALSVQTMLEDFSNGKPTLKDISSLIAMTIQLARKIDKEITDFSKEDVDMLLDHYDLHRQIKRIRKETSPQKSYASIERLIKAHAPSLLESYWKFYSEEL